MCAHVLSTATYSEVSESTRLSIWRAYKSPGFIDKKQRERYIRIFGADAVA
jgi:hypothetical protein